MDCGVPFCHTGCPLNNLIPDWNDLVYRGRWREAVRQLHATNNFPEFTGRICPAPCEASCVLGINEPAGHHQADRKRTSWSAACARAGSARTARVRTGKRVAVVGSGPAGLAAAQQLCRAGHCVTVFEKADRIGGLLRYGIPDFKLEKHLLDRRLEQMEAEGVKFRTGAHVGVNVPVEELRDEFDAILLAGGAEQPRDLQRPRPRAERHPFRHGRSCRSRTSATTATRSPSTTRSSATGKHVVIIGGGDTGADCLGTCHRQKAASVHQFEIMPMPPDERSPLDALAAVAAAAAHRKLARRRRRCATGASPPQNSPATSTDECRQLHAVRVGPPPKFEPIPGTEFVLKRTWCCWRWASAAGADGMIEQLGVELDARGNVKTTEQYMTSVPGVFAAGDMRRGQSLVVWAIAEGRRAAAAVDRYLRENS